MATVPTKKIVVLAAASSVLLMVLALSWQDPGTTEAVVGTANFLRHLCASIARHEELLNGPAPTSMPDLVKWLCESDVVRSRPGELEEDTGMIYDRWGEPVVLVVEGGRLVGLGSAGADRTWRNGKGDDIVFKVEDFR